MAGKKSTSVKEATKKEPKTEKKKVASERSASSADSGSVHREVVLTQCETSCSQGKGQDSATVALRAWEIWQSEGCVEGRELEHWFQAERELAGRKASLA
jgi:hypothetical protein